MAKKTKMEKFVFQMQIDAVVRALFLIGKEKEMTIRDVLHSLANAEEKSQFLCGFVLLATDGEEIEKELSCYLVGEGFTTINNAGHLKLTESGKERAKIELPPQIEECL